MRVISGEELKAAVEKHKKWLNGETDGAKLILNECYLRDYDLRNSDLRNSDLRGCQLQNSDLRGCQLQNSDLRDCNLDYSCFSLWCGGLDVHVDDRIAIQLLYHLVRNALFSKNTSNELKEFLGADSILEWANKFHLVGECGYIKKEVL